MLYPRQKLYILENYGMSDDELFEGCLKRMKPTQRMITKQQVIDFLKSLIPEPKKKPKKVPVKKAKEIKVKIIKFRKPRKFKEKYINKTPYYDPKEYREFYRY
jgi:hypothetical protein